jgi:hypothetical protein
MRRFLMILAVCAVMPFSAWADDDPIKAKLDEAKHQYYKTADKLHKNVLDELEKKEAAARDKGDKKAVDQVKADREAFTERDVVPKFIANDYSKDLSRAQSALVSAYETAIKDYTKAKNDSEATKIEEELKQFKKDIAPKATTAAKVNYFIGTFSGMSGEGGFTEIWTIKKEDGKWSITGVFKKDDKEAGSFHGEDYKYGNDGVLRFRQVYDQKPKASWGDGTILGCVASKDKLLFRWQNPGKAAGPFTTLTRVKE